MKVGTRSGGGERGVPLDQRAAGDVGSGGEALLEGAGLGGRLDGRGLGCLLEPRARA